MKNELKRANVFIPVSSLLMVILAFNLLSQDPVRFERISVEQGLQQNIVMSVLQDYKGFLWIGTSDGLNRYDGYGFKLYKHDPNNHGSLPNNKIHYIYQDKSNNLWFASDGGLSKYDRLTDSFVNYCHLDDNPDSLISNEVFYILEDSRGNFWIGTYSAGLDKFVDGKKFIHYGHNPDDPYSLSNNNVWAIFEDIYDRLWIGTAGGLNLFDRNKQVFTCYRNIPNNPDSISNDNVYAIAGDKKGALWIGTALGLDILEPGPVNMKVTHYKINGSLNNPGDTRVQCLLIDNSDNNGVAWIGTYGGGLKRFDREKGTIISYLSNPHDFYTISHNYVNAIYKDNGGALWIGTRGGGLNKLNLDKRFELYQEDPSKPGGLNHNVILSIIEDRRGDLWVGTFDFGLNRLNKDRTQAVYYKNDPLDPRSLANNIIRSICEDRDGTLWIGTDKGVDKYNRTTNSFTHYAHDPANPNSLSNNKVRSKIFQDHSGKLWIGTVDGLNEFDPVKETFTHYGNDPNDSDSPYYLPAATVMAVIEEVRDGKPWLWIGTYDGGLSLYDRQKKMFTHYRHNPDDPKSLSNENVRALYIDRTGTLWVCTDGGLNKFVRETGQFIIYREQESLMKDGLASNSIYGILEDNDGNLWLSTLKGLSKFNPREGTFRNYDVRDGLQGNEFSQGAYYKTKDGELFFGGPNGFNSFFPGKIKDNLRIPPVYLTDFRVDNKPPDINRGNQHPLPKAISEMSETDAIQLYYKENIFSFEFAALDFLSPGKNRYAYKMENLDNDWNYVTADKRFVVYTNMKPGQYVFRVKASNNDGLWNEKGTALRIIIRPPFWETWWFRGILIAVGCVLLLAGYFWRTRWLRTKLAEQERVRKLLTQSRDEMEKSRDLAEFRSAENEKVMTAISSIFIAVDADGKIFRWNNPTEKFFGLSAHDAIDKPFSEYLRDYIPAGKLIEILQAGLGQEISTVDLEIPIYFKKHGESKGFSDFGGSGESGLLLASINPIIDKKGKKFGFLLLAEDITNRKREEVQRYLSQKLEALGQMAAGIAHEIRSPLQYIGDNGRFLLEAFGGLVEYCREVKSSAGEVLKDEIKTIPLKLQRFIENSDFDFYANEIPKAAEQIVDGVTRVSNIVKSMNEFAHIGNEVDEKSDLNELLQSTVVVAHNWINKVADLETSYTPGLPLIHCGMGELNQVFLNLLSNAADAVAETGKRGLIKIVTRRQDDESVVEISDTGVGIPEEIKSKMFTPFFTTKGLGKGTGQGLHLSYRIIAERYKGRLYFKSKVNEGTTFYIHLPQEEAN
jgi:PAS domain S-box-containing protein